MARLSTKKRYEEILRWFGENVPEPRTELTYDTPFHLLLAAAREEDVYEYIKSVTFPNNKTRHLIKAAQVLMEEFGGEMPSDIDSLMKLPGVGRKTANVMLAVVWNKAAMAVDTHVFRVSNRIGLTDNSKTPAATEKTLIRHIPAELVPKAHHWLILHGRYICKARKPLCGECGIREWCRTYSGR